MNLKHKLPYAIGVFSLLAIINCKNTSEENKVEDVVVETSSLESIKEKYNTDIPDKILTPDVVETRLGTLNFFDGLPSEETTKKVYDNLDFMRGVETEFQRLL